MWFLFGLIVGSSLAGSPGAVLQQQLLSQIPLRCFAALEEGEQAYRDCRWTSMAKQLDQQSPAVSDRGNGRCWNYAWKRSWVDDNAYACDVQKHLSWELAALKRVNEEARKAQPK